MKRLIDAYNTLLDRLVEEACTRVLASGNPLYAKMPTPMLQAVVRRAFGATAEDLGRNTPEAIPALLSALGTQRSAEGVRCQHMLSGISLGFDTVSDVFAKEFPNDLELRLAWEAARARIATAGAAALADAYLEARERVVRAQSEEILELSVRVLPLFRGVLLMPLIGRLDAARAERVMDALLSAVSSQSAKVVLFDLTGLPEVDLDVATHLVRAASAVQLLGATPALVGVRANLAFAMAKGSVDLGGVKTLSTLEEGILYARKLLFV